ERSADDEIAEEVSRVLHAELRSVLPQRSAHHRISASCTVCAILCRHDALFGVHWLHRQLEPSRRHRHGLLRRGARDGAPVVGAHMQGATFLSESLAQYSALMVMEKEYGRDTMRKFLKYEMDNYLRSRGRERHKEEPLLTVESQQGYVHYRKASVVLYYLKEMIGEEAVNRALRKVIKQYAYNAPPYPTSYALVDALREQTPPNLQYLIKDLFEDITLFSNRTLDA